MSTPKFPVTLNAHPKLPTFDMDAIAFGKKDLNKKLAKILKKMGKTPEQIQNFKYYLKV